MFWSYLAMSHAYIHAGGRLQASCGQHASVNMIAALISPGSLSTLCLDPILQMRGGVSGVVFLFLNQEGLLAKSLNCF